jgi:hypothetical protein
MARRQFESEASSFEEGEEVEIDGQTVGNYTTFLLLEGGEEEVVIWSNHHYNERRGEDEEDTASNPTTSTATTNIINFQERLSEINAKWKKKDTPYINNYFITAEAKKNRQCLVEEENEEENIRINCKIHEHMSRLYKIKDEMKSLGAKLNSQSSPALYGYIPSNWVDSTLYSAELKKLKQEIDQLEKEFEKWKLAMNINHSISIFRNGIVVPHKAQQPCEHDHDHNYNDDHNTSGSSSNTTSSNIKHIRSKISTFASLLSDKQREFHNLLSNYKPVDLKTLQEKLSKLNRERQTIIYELRIFECKGFYTGFNTQDFFLE